MDAASPHLISRAYTILFRFDPENAVTIKPYKSLLHRSMKSEDWVTIKARGVFEIPFQITF
jgi:hypothetical protein